MDSFTDELMKIFSQYHPEGVAFYPYSEPEEGVIAIKELLSKHLPKEKNTESMSDTGSMIKELQNKPWNDCLKQTKQNLGLDREEMYERGSS